MNIKHIFNICLFFHTSILFAAQTIVLSPEAGSRSRANSHHSFENVRAWQETQRTETRTNTLADTVAHAGTFSPHTPAYAISSSGDWTFGDPEQVARRERERLASLPEHRIALYKKIRPTIAALLALSYQETQRVVCKPAKPLHIKPEILALNHFVHQNEDVLPDFIDDTQPLAPSTLVFPRIENLEALKSIALTYPKRRVVVLLVPQAKKQAQKEESVAFIQCREATDSETAEFDKDGKLHLSHVHFQKCYESSDEKSDFIKSKQNSLPGMEFSAFDGYSLQIFIPVISASTANIPVVNAVAAGVAVTYIVIKDRHAIASWFRALFRSKKKAEEVAKKAQESLQSNGTASPGPEDPKDDKNQRKKIRIAEDNKKHIFCDKKGHLPDTSTSRKLLEDLVADTKNFLEIDGRGNKWFAKTLENGKQIWARVWGDAIRDGGMNDTVIPWDPETGLCRNIRK